MLLVNKLPLEEYVYGVLRYEIFQSWPLEMQKVQAVASRTYAVYCMNSNRKKPKNKQNPFDIRSTKKHQSYLGTHQYTHLKQAIKETDGKIITYHDNVIMAMFDSCCGGVIPANIEHHHFENAPYLAREKACTYCKECKLFTWEKKLSLSSFIQHLRANTQIASRLQTLNPIDTIAISKSDKAGIVQNITLGNARRRIELGSKELHTNLSTFFRSLCFSMKQCNANPAVGDNEPILTLVGRGYGHHTGLCQYGARELVHRGWHYKNILRLYYPNTHFTNLI